MDNEHKHAYEGIKITKKEKSVVLIEGELPAEELEKAWPQAIAEVSQHVKLKGFRDGKVPEAVLIKEIGEMPILEEAAEMALSHAYGHLVADNMLAVIGSPKVNITKLARNNPVGFKIEVAIVPEVSIKEYEKDLAKITLDENLEVTAKDIDEVVEHLRRNRTAIEKGKGGEEQIDPKSLSAEELLPFDDEFAKSLGAFENVEDFKKKVGSQMLEEKKREEKDKKRQEIIDLLLSKTIVELPDVLVESELYKMMAQMRGEIEHAGLKFDDYLKQVNKTEEELKKDWEPSAEKRVTVQLILHHLAKEHNLMPTESETAAETEKVLQIYKTADKERARMFAEEMLANEKVFSYLEGKIAIKKSESKK